MARRFGEQKAREVERLIETLPITLVEADKELPREAARMKSLRPMAYADCFAAALARIKRGELYTGDREFKQLEKETKIIWFPRKGT